MKSLNTGQSIKGFTLIEVLLYISLAAFTLLATSTLFFFVIQSRLKQQAISEVEEQGTMMLSVVTQAVRNAKDFSDLTPGTSNATSLTLTVPTEEANPTIFDLVDGTFRSTKGSGSTVALTSPRVAMTNLSFHNLGQTATTGTVRIQFTLSTVNPTGMREFSYQQTFYGSATTR